jgi:hypothetical protein
MTKHLLAAEADKIQDFLFRSAKLREVVGGSQLLTRFCQKAAGKLMEKHGVPQEKIKEQIITADGGGFRITFETKDKAQAFGQDLAELYRLALDASLTVAEPVAYEPDFKTTSDKANTALRLAKQQRSGGAGATALSSISIMNSGSARPLTSSHDPVGNCFL